MTEGLTLQPEQAPIAAELAQLRTEFISRAEDRALAEVRPINFEGVRRIPDCIEDASNGAFSNEGSLSPYTALILRESGTDPAQIIDPLHKRQDALPDQLITIGGFQFNLISIDRGKGITLSPGPRDLSSEEKSTLLQTVSDLAEKTDAVQSLAKLAEQVGSGQKSGNTVIDLTDTLSAAAALSQAGLLKWDTDFMRKTIAGNVTPDEFKAYLISPLREGWSSTSVSKEEAGSAVTFFAPIGDKAVTMRLAFTSDSPVANLSYEINPSAYLEKADQRIDATSEPFIQTEEAEKLFNEFERAGLRISSTLKDILTKPGPADRYGSPFTHMTREIAKWVNRGKVSPTALGSLFDYEANDFNVTLDKIQSMSIGFLGEASAKMVDIMQQVVNAQRGGEPRKSAAKILKPTAEEIDMKDGSCFDAVEYFNDRFRAKDLFPDPNVRTSSDEQLHAYAERTGKARLVTAEPVIINGIILPSGVQLRQMKDGYAFLRFTPWVIKTQTARDQVFATEMIKAKMYGEKFRRLGQTAFAQIL